ncbi:MAG: peptide chain release factor-like protein [Planctomycetota bacterium]
MAERANKPDDIAAIFDRPPIERTPHPASLDDDALMARCEWTRSKGGGPGGQNRNKVETTVELRHTATGVHAKAGERRSVRENKSVGIKRLRLALAVEHREPVPAGEIRSALWRSRSKSGRLVINPKHRDYPSLLAEALDVIHDAGYDLRRAGTRLVCTTSQLVRLLSHHPPALALVNEARQAHGMRPLQPK